MDEKDSFIVWIIAIYLLYFKWLIKWLQSVTVMSSFETKEPVMKDQVLQ